MIARFRLLYRQHWQIRWLWWLAVVIPGVPFVLISLGLISYMHWPRAYLDNANIELDNGANYLTIAAHGVKDSPTSWGEPLGQIMKAHPHAQLANLKQQYLAIDWQKYADNALICSVAGKSLGRQLASEAARLPNLKAVHLIGHSCGAFVALGFCQQIKTLKPSIVVQSTYLDPVAIYSGIFWQYGINNFGRCADFSDSYIDTEDGVPGSNQSLPHSITFDVTTLKAPNNAKVPPHAWPTLFYLEAMSKQQVPIFYLSDQSFERRYNKNELQEWRGKF